MPPKQPHQSTALLGHLPAKNFNSFLVTYWGEKCQTSKDGIADLPELNHFQASVPASVPINYILGCNCQAPVSSKTVAMLSLCCISACTISFTQDASPVSPPVTILPTPRLPEYATILREPSSLTPQEREVLVYVFETSVVF